VESPHAEKEIGVGMETRNYEIESLACCEMRLSQGLMKDRISAVEA